MTTDGSPTPIGPHAGQHVVSAPGAGTGRFSPLSAGGARSDKSEAESLSHGLHQPPNRRRRSQNQRRRWASSSSKMRFQPEFYTTGTRGTVRKTALGLETLSLVENRWCLLSGIDTMAQTVAQTAARSLVTRTASFRQANVVDQIIFRDFGEVAQRLDAPAPV